MVQIQDVGVVIFNKEDPLLKMWHATIGPGKRGLHPHKHTFFEINLVTCGHASYFTPSGEYDLHEGDMLVFSSNENHCSTEVFDSDMGIITLQFDPRYLIGSRQDSLSKNHRDFCFVHASNFAHFIPSYEAAPLSHLFLQIKEELESQTEEYSLYVKSLLNMLIISLIRDYGYSSEAAFRRSSDIFKVLEYIDNHLAEKLTLEELSAVAGVSPTYFSALFKSFCNETLWHYVSAKRIEKAMRLLQRDDFHGNMLEIALACGFNNTANFNKAFRKHTGMTPSNYRNMGDILLH